MMTVQSLITEPSRVDEPGVVQEYSNVLSQVAAEGRPIIVRRNGEDLAAIVPLELLDAIREAVAWQEVEKTAKHIDWDRLKSYRPSQSWLKDDENPFEPEPETPS
jgi:prevent-host-death family protein